MLFRSTALSLVILASIGCTDLIGKLAKKKRDAGIADDPPPTTANATANEPPPAESVATATAPSNGDGEITKKEVSRRRPIAERDSRSPLILAVAVALALAPPPEAEAGKGRGKMSRIALAI